MQNVNSSAKLPQLLRRQLTSDPFRLIDVGCSGGVEAMWNVFGLNLEAIGFDPLLAETERLRRHEKRPDIVYEAAFVGCKSFDDLFPPALRSDRIKSRSNDSFARTSAARAMQAMRLDYARDVFNRGAEVKLADRKVELDEYLSEKQIASVDFIKIDTDGHDIEVLLGAGETLRSRGVLGLQVECQFHGPTHPYANVFSNIDRLMRDAGYTLYLLDLIHYARGAMPRPFVYDITAQTHGGSVQWADALYMRDLADPTYTEMTGFAPTDSQIVKLACLFELYGLDDCAAELIVNRPAAFGGMADELLDSMTPLRGPSPGRYRRFLDLFDRDPTQLFPSKLRAGRAS